MNNLIFPVQLKNESNSHYSLFKWYCTLGPERSIKRFSNESNKSERALYDMAKRNDWTARSTEFDLTQSENQYQESETFKSLKRSEYIDVLLQIQQQLLETVDYISNIKLEEIFTEEDNIDTKITKSTRILKYYAKFIQIIEKLDHSTDQILSSNKTHEDTKKDINALQLESKKIEKSLQISAKTAEN